MKWCKVNDYTFCSRLIKKSLSSSLWAIKNILVFYNTVLNKSNSILKESLISSNTGRSHSIVTLNEKRDRQSRVTKNMYVRQRSPSRHGFYTYSIYGWINNAVVWLSLFSYNTFSYIKVNSHTDDKALKSLWNISNRWD